MTEEDSFVERIRERRRRGTRAPMDLQYGFRSYLTVLTFIFMGLAEGIRRALDDTPTTQATGAGLLLAVGASVLLIVRWLLRPVDDDALERRDADREALGHRPWRTRRGWSNPFDHVPRDRDRST